MRKWLLLVALIVLCDQVTKYLAQYLLEEALPLAVLPSFNLTLVYNSGAAFSLLSEAGGWQRWFFIILTSAICVVLIGWLRKEHTEDVLSSIGITMILGGAFGNLIDRILFGRVIDFLDFYYEHYHWPVFNVADISITLGALTIVMAALFEKKGEKQVL